MRGGIRVTCWRERANCGAMRQADSIGLASSERFEAPLKRQAGLARWPIGKLERLFGVADACETLQQLEKATIGIQGADVIRVRCLGVVDLDSASVGCDPHNDHFNEVTLRERTSSARDAR